MILNNSVKFLKDIVQMILFLLIQDANFASSLLNQALLLEKLYVIT